MLYTINSGKVKVYVYSTNKNMITYCHGHSISVYDLEEYRNTGKDIAL